MHTVIIQMGIYILAILLSITAMRLVASRYRQPAYKPIRVEAVKRRVSMIKKSRADHIM